MSKNLIEEAWDAFESVAPSLVSTGHDLLKDVADKAGEYLKEHGEEIVDGAIDVVKGIFGGS